MSSRPPLEIVSGLPGPSELMCGRLELMCFLQSDFKAVVGFAAFEDFAFDAVVGFLDKIN